MSYTDNKEMWEKIFEKDSLKLILFGSLLVTEDWVRLYNASKKAKDAVEKIYSKATRTNVRYRICISEKLTPEQFLRPNEIDKYNDRKEKGKGKYFDKSKKCIVINRYTPTSVNASMVERRWEECVYEYTRSTGEWVYGDINRDSLYDILVRNFYYSPTSELDGKRLVKNNFVPLLK